MWWQQGILMGSWDRTFWRVLFLSLWCLPSSAWLAAWAQTFQCRLPWVSKDWYFWISFRLCGEWMKVVYCIPSKVTVYPAIYRSCISLQGLVQGGVRDCPLNYNLVLLWYTRECEKWVVMVSFYSMTSCCISLYSYQWGTNQGQVKVPPLVWVALFTSSTGRGIGMLQSALELVSGESLSPTQCTVGNFVQISDSSSRLVSLHSYMGFMHTSLQKETTSTVAQYWDSWFSAAQTCGRGTGHFVWSRWKRHVGRPILTSVSHSTRVSFYTAGRSKI